MNVSRSLRACLKDKGNSHVLYINSRYYMTSRDEIKIVRTSELEQRASRTRLYAKDSCLEIAARKSRTTD